MSDPSATTTEALSALAQAAWDTAQQIEDSLNKGPWTPWSPVPTEAQREASFALCAAFRTFATLIQEVSS